MIYEHIYTHIDNNLLTITLNNPKKLNAMTSQMRVDLMDCIKKAENDENICAIIFTGMGNRAFCAGANIPELETRKLQSEIGPASNLRKELPTTIERLSKPTIAAINGYCYGAGLEFCLGCTVRIGDSNASLGQPEINLGHIPGSGGTQRLYRFVGLGWAMQMILSGRPIDAKTAFTIGLLTEITEPADLLNRAKTIATELGSKPPISFAAARDAVLRSTESDLLTGIDYEKKLYSIVVATDDSREGLAAFNEKRIPTYKGK